MQYILLFYGNSGYVYTYMPCLLSSICFSCWSWAEGSEVVKTFSRNSDTLESIVYFVSMHSGAELLDTRAKMLSERCYQNI